MLFGASGEAEGRLRLPACVVPCGLGAEYSIPSKRPRHIVTDDKRGGTKSTYMSTI